MPDSTYEAIVWREDNRIRRANGSGYGDMVPDADIAQHVRDDLARGAYDDAVFGAAVLALREQERAPSRYESTDLFRGLRG